MALDLGNWILLNKDQLTHFGYERWRIGRIKDYKDFKSGLVDITERRAGKVTWLKIVDNRVSF